jgi:glycosyltransferase involved in cell wall biosynthesis
MMDSPQTSPHSPPSQLQPAVIIPVYNHGHQIAEVIQQTQRLGLPVFVVNDGSTDSTAQVIDKIEDIHVLHHPVNRGKGAAILTGLVAASKSGCDLAITIDGDGQHDPGDTWSLLHACGNGGHLIVVGSRQGMVKGRNVPWTSRFGRKFSNFWVWASGGPWLEDSQSGFRLYPVAETLELGVKAQRYQFEVEVLVKAKQSGISIKNAPVSVIYQDKGKRVSHFRPWLDFWRNSATFSRLIFARIFRIFRP